MFFAPCFFDPVACIADASEAPMTEDAAARWRGSIAISRFDEGCTGLEDEGSTCLLDEGCNALEDEGFTGLEDDGSTSLEDECATFLEDDGATGLEEEGCGRDEVMWTLERDLWAPCWRSCEDC